MPALPGTKNEGSEQARARWRAERAAEAAVCKERQPMNPTAEIKTPAATAEDLNPFSIAMRQFDIAAEHLKLEPSMREIMKHPKRQLIVSIPTLMHDGTYAVFEGYRVQHSIARGPAKG